LIAIAPAAPIARFVRLSCLKAMARLHAPTAPTADASAGAVAAKQGYTFATKRGPRGPARSCQGIRRLGGGCVIQQGRPDVAGMGNRFSRTTILPPLRRRPMGRISISHEDTRRARRARVRATSWCLCVNQNSLRLRAQ
jgi:hypothetical protein